MANNGSLVVENPAGLSLGEELVRRLGDGSAASGEWPVRVILRPGTRLRVRPSWRGYRITRSLSTWMERLAGVSGDWWPIGGTGGPAVVLEWPTPPAAAATAEQLAATLTLWRAWWLRDPAGVTHARDDAPTGAMRDTAQGPASSGPSPVSAPPGPVAPAPAPAVWRPGQPGTVSVSYAAGRLSPRAARRGALPVMPPARRPGGG
jgi:hypothetical protein